MCVATPGVTPDSETLHTVWGTMPHGAFTSIVTCTHELQLRFYYFLRFGWLLWQEIGHFVKLLAPGKQTVAGCWAPHQYR